MRRLVLFSIERGNNWKITITARNARKSPNSLLGPYGGDMSSRTCSGFLGMRVAGFWYKLFGS